MTSITDVDENLFLKILCFLPAKSIIRCSCVCKDWASLIYQPYFLDLYFSCREAPLQLVLQRENNIVLAQLDDEDLYTAINFSNNSNFSDLNIALRFGPPPDDVCLKVCTCNYTCWIVALDLHPYFMYSRYNKTCPQYHMYNPITGQHIVVQQPKRRDDLVWHNCALILAKRSNELKLLEIYQDKQGRAQAYIQTIGTNTWRRIENVPCQDYQDYRLVMPVLLNGQCHWLDCDKMVINSFDTEEEVFKVIQTPLSFKDHTLWKFGLLDGCLCLTKLNWHYDTEVWVMNKYGTWTQIFVVVEPYVQPLIRLQNGEILMLGHKITGCQDKHSAVMRYNQHSGAYRYINSADSVNEVMYSVRLFDTSRRF